ncbi:MAG: DNA repair protein RecO [Gemmatimonadetes bacterium]|nr:DNA repair protein RecO [Gemmatimonadota bacterium]
MPLVTTPAIILHAFKYSDTSKIVRLATREYGVQSAIAKGASRPKSRFGASLQVLSQGTAHLYFRPTAELQTLSAFDVAEQHPALAHDLGRYAAASALAELMLRCAPSEPHLALFDFVGAQLDHLATVPPQRVATAALAGLWAMVTALGFAPTVSACVRDGRALDEGAVGFSVPDGGFLCARCTRERTTTVLEAPDRLALERLLQGSDELPAGWAPRHAAAHRRLLARFIEHHLAEGHPLKALAFWETAAWNGTS